MSEHQHARHHDGPRVPARYGSLATEVCSCGAWRTVGNRPAWWLGWRPVSELQELVSCMCGDEYELNDECPSHGQPASPTPTVSRSFARAVRKITDAGDAWRAARVQESADPVADLREALHAAQMFAGSSVVHPITLPNHVVVPEQFWRELVQTCQQILTASDGTAAHSDDWLTRSLEALKTEMQGWPQWKRDAASQDEHLSLTRAAQIASRSDDPCPMCKDDGKWCGLCLGEGTATPRRVKTEDDQSVLRREVDRLNQAVTTLQSVLAVERRRREQAEAERDVLKADEYLGPR